MRIVVKNIHGIEHEDVKQLLNEWIEVEKDASSYYVSRNGLGRFYLSVSMDNLTSLAAVFNSDLKKQLGPDSSLEVCAVQEVPPKFSDKTKPSGSLVHDAVYKSYLKSPSTWTLQTKTKVKKPSQKLKEPKDKIKDGAGKGNPKNPNAAKTSKGAQKGPKAPKPPKDFQPSKDKPSNTDNAPKEKTPKDPKDRKSVPDGEKPKPKKKYYKPKKAAQNAKN